MSIDYLSLAKRSANWIMENQFLEERCNLPNGEKDLITMYHHGRFVRNRKVDTQEISHLSSNWTNGMAMYALLAMRDHVGGEDYLNASIESAKYICSLQLFYPGNPHSFGMILEGMHFLPNCHPRDALSAAWGLLRLYKATGKFEYLDRARYFADWHSTYALKNGYPVCTFFCNDRENDERPGSFQGGSVLFYLELYILVKDPKYLEISRGIADFYIDPKHFFDPKKGFRVLFDIREEDSEEDTFGGDDWNDMHKFNDDFSSLGLLFLYFKTGEKQYLNFVVSYLDWCLTQQHDDGGFGKTKLSVGSCVAALNFLNAFMVTKREDYKKAAYAALEHTMESFVDRPDAPLLDGGVLGLDHIKIDPENNSISLRVTMYAIYTLMLFDIYEKHVEPGSVKEISREIKENPMFVGLRFL